jgi:hypothetical protein
MSATNITGQLSENQMENKARELPRYINIIGLDIVQFYNNKNMIT